MTIKPALLFILASAFSEILSETELCLCLYKVEIALYAQPDKTSPVIGYMFEFDCKPRASENDVEGFYAVQFEHQVMQCSYNVDILFNL